MAVQINVVGTYNGKELDRAQKQLADLSKDVEHTGGRFKNFGSSVGGGLKKAAIGFAALGGAAIGAGVIAKKFIDLGSNLQETMSKVEVVFGDSADQVKAFGKTAAVSMGISNQKALEAAGTYGNLLQAFGTTREKATEMSTSMVQLAGDLASFNNVSVEDALLALRSGMSGETEPLKKFGVAINDVRLKEEALALGLYDGSGQLSVLAKSQAAYALIMKDTTLAQGDYLRTASGVANTQRTIGAQFQDVATTIGTALIPAFSNVLGFISTKVLPGFTGLATAISEGGLSGAIGFLGEGIKKAAPLVLDGLKSLISKIVEWVASDGVQLLGKTVAFLSDVFVNWVLPALPGLLTKLGELVSRLMNWISGTLQPLLVEKLIVVGNAFFGWVTPMIPKLLNKLRDLFISMGQFIVDKAVPQLVEQAKKLGDALVGWISPLLRTLPKQLMDFAIVIVKWILSEGVPALLDAALNLGKALLGWLPGLAVDLIAGIASAAFSLVKALPGLFIDVAKGFFKLGGVLLSLLISGIEAGFGFLKGLAIDAVNVLITAFNAIPIIPNIDLIKKDTQAATKEFGNFAEKALGVGAAVTTTAGSLRTFNKDLEGPIKGVIDLGTAAGDTGAALGGEGGGGKGGGGKKSIAAGAKEAAERLKDMAKSFEDVKKKTEEFGTTIGEALLELGGTEGGVTPLQSAVMDLEDFKTALDGVNKVGPEAGTTFAKIVDNLGEQLIGSLKETKERLKEAKEAFADFAKDVKSSIMGALNFSATGTTDRIKAIADAEKALSDARKAAADPKATDAEKKAVTVAQSDLDEAKAAGQALGLTFIDALKAQAKKAADFGVQVRTLVSMGLSPEALKQVLDAGVDAGSLIAKELIAGGVTAITETNEILKAAQAAAAEVGELAASAYFQAGIDNATQQIAGLREQIVTLTPTVLTTMDELAVKMRRQVKIDVKISQKEFDVNVFVTKHIREVVTRQVIEIKGPVTAKAEGGPVTKAMSYLVGEKGPELFVPNRSGTIIPNGAGGGTVINLNVNAGLGTDGSEVGDAIVDALTRYQRRNGAIPVKVTG